MKLKAVCLIATNGIHWRRRDFGVQPFSLYSKVYSRTPVEHLAFSPAFANEIVSGWFVKWNVKILVSTQKLT